MTMTTLNTLTIHQVRALCREAIDAGDLDTADDCELVIRHYERLPLLLLADALKHRASRYVTRAAKRIVSIIQDAEGQRDTVPAPPPAAWLEEQAYEENT